MLTDSGRTPSIDDRRFTELRERPRITDLSAKVLMRHRAPVVARCQLRARADFIDRGDRRDQQGAFERQLEQLCFRKAAREALYRKIKLLVLFDRHLAVD